MMARAVAVEREEKNRLDKAKSVNHIIGSKALVAENNTKKDDKTKPTPKAKAESAAPLLSPYYQNLTPKCTLNMKRENANTGRGKKKGLGKDRSRGRSPSQDRKSIPCIYHFRKGGCSKGKDCPFSHSKKKAPRGSRTGPGNGKGGNPKNDRTPSPQPKSEKPCFLHAKGKCDRSDCLYKHDNEAAPAESGSAKAKAAAPKGKAKAAAAKAKSAAVVVEVKGENNDGYLSADWSDAEDSSPVAAGRALRKKPTNHVRKDKMVKIKRKPEKIILTWDLTTVGYPRETRPGSLNLGM